MNPICTNRASKASVWEIVAMFRELPGIFIDDINSSCYLATFWYPQFMEACTWCPTAQMPDLLSKQLVRSMYTVNADNHLAASSCPLLSSCQESFILMLIVLRFKADTAGRASDQIMTPWSMTCIHSSYEYYLIDFSSCSLSSIMCKHSRVVLH